MNEKPDRLKALYPWPQSTLTVNGRRNAYVDDGPKSTRPVPLLHDNPTWSASTATSSSARARRSP